MQSRSSSRQRESNEHAEERRPPRRLAPHLEQGLTLLVLAALLAVVSVSCQPLAQVPAQSLLAALSTLEALPPAAQPAPELNVTPEPSATPEPSPTLAPTLEPTIAVEPSPTAPPTATEIPPTAVPPTAVPPTQVPATAVPPTAVPPTTMPPTVAAPTAVPPTAVPPAPAAGPAVASPTSFEAPTIGLSVRVVPMGYQEMDLGGGIKGTAWVVPVNAAGWQQGSALPWNSGNMVIAGHSNTGGSVFRNLGGLNVGDVVIVRVGDVAYPYAISERVLVREAGASVEERIANGRWTPDGASHRLILVARPVR